MYLVAMEELVKTVWFLTLTFVLCAIQVNHHLVNCLLLNHRYILRIQEEQIGYDSNYSTSAQH